MRIKEKFERKLLVEGNDDQHVIWSLCNKLRVLENFDVIDCGGIDNLLSQIPVRLKQSGTIAIGLVVDADADIIKRWNSIKELLNSLHFTCPDTLPKTGLIIENDGIRFGVWIMPDNNLNGMLENFISFLVPQDDQLLLFAAQTILKIEESGLNKYQLDHRSKALIHSWLSWQNDPGTPFGLAITKEYLTTDVEKCRLFINWLSEIFS